jgi:hypothetical protein
MKQKRDETKKEIKEVDEINKNILKRKREDLIFSFGS